MSYQNLHNRITLQDRDISLIRMLAEDFRILTREQIGELFPMGSTRRLNFRLKQLCDAGYLSSRRLDQMGAIRKSAYYPGPRAVEMFDDATEQRLVATRRAQTTQLAESGLAHRMLVDSIHIRFLTAVRENPNYKLVTWIDQYSPSWADLQKYGVPLQADGYGEYLMLLHFENLYTFFLEVDRGTEWGKTMQDKIDRYVRYAESGTYERLFAAKQFRVLVVTTRTHRMEGLLKLMESKPINLFWITTWERFKQAKLLDAYWFRPNQKGTYSLLSHI